MKAAFGLVLVVVVNSLQFWLSASVLLSWVMKSKYFFPVPNISIRPASLIAAASGNTGGAGPLGNYGINVGPMAISWFFRFVNGRLELFMGRALAESNKRQRKQRKAVKKEQEKKEAAIATEERRAARRVRREARKKAAEEVAENDDSAPRDEEERTKQQPNPARDSTDDDAALNNKSENVHSTTATNEKVQVAPECGTMDELD